jgi:hypothetical protein
MIQITRSGLIFSGSSHELDELKQQFQSFHYIRLSDFFDPELLQQLKNRIDRADWHELVHEGIGVENCISDKGVTGVLNFLMNNENLFRLIEKITECGSIGSFGGRLYRMVPGSGHHDSWHTDMGEYRLLALSMNLTKEIYQGGVLQICERKTGASLQEIPNNGFGDAILFRLASHLQHRITNMDGIIPKTAFAGWFRSQPDFRSVLKRDSAEAS